MNKAEQIKKAEETIKEAMRILVEISQEGDTNLDLALCNLRQAKRAIRKSK